MEIVETYKDKWGHINYICNCEICGGDAHYRRKISGPSICLRCSLKIEKEKARARYKPKPDKLDELVKRLEKIDSCEYAMFSLCLIREIVEELKKGAE